MMWLICMMMVVGAEVLDIDMTPEEQKATGISKLNAKQKAALQHWIDANYEKRSEPIAADEKEMRSELEENLRNGAYIRLKNGTLWQIYPNDTNISFGWISAVTIIITKSGDPEYPYKLTNSLTKSSVKARKVTAIPSQ